jgi:hypothetical protein
MCRRGLPREHLPACRPRARRGGPALRARSVPASPAPTVPSVAAFMDRPVAPHTDQNPGQQWVRGRLAAHPDRDPARCAGLGDRRDHPQQRQLPRVVERGHHAELAGLPAAPARSANAAAFAAVATIGAVTDTSAPGVRLRPGVRSGPGGRGGPGGPGGRGELAVQRLGPVGGHRWPAQAQRRLGLRGKAEKRSRLVAPAPHVTTASAGPATRPSGPSAPTGTPVSTEPGNTGRESAVSRLASCQPFPTGTAVESLRVVPTSGCGAAPTRP